MSKEMSYDERVERLVGLLAELVRAVGEVGQLGKVAPAARRAWSKAESKARQIVRTQFGNDQGAHEAIVQMFRDHPYNPTQPPDEITDAQADNVNRWSKSRLESEEYRGPS